MGGEETIRQIRKIDPQVPVVVTGSPGGPTEQLKKQDDDIGQLESRWEPSVGLTIYVRPYYLYC